MKKDFRISGGAHSPPILAMAFLLSFVPGTTVASPDGEDWLARCIAYHDPDGTWMKSRVRLSVRGSYADGRTNQRDCVIDYQNGDFSIAVEIGGVVAEQGLKAGLYWCRVDGHEDPTQPERETYKLNPERATLMRDYMGFLWGLPMKLRDPGTRISATVNSTTFNQQSVRDIKISYDPEVGRDIWHIYVDPTDAHLVGYAFYHDAAETEGEIITLEGEVVVGTARIPRARTWTRVADGTLLGTDTLLGGEIQTPSF